MFNTVRRALKRFNKNRELFLLALPSVIFIFIFAYIPMYGLVLPFKDFKVNLGFFESEWVGFNNFKFLFTSNSALVITRNTLIFNGIFIISGLVVSVGFALILFEMKSKAVKLYQTALFIPYFISWIVASYVCIGIFDMEHGLFNMILTQLGRDPILWYNKLQYWPFILAAANLWKSVGYSTLIYYAALVAIDSELYQAASLDGASSLQQVRLISIPLLKPLIVLLTTLSIGRIFNSDFGMFYHLTRDSPLLYPVTDVIDTFVYRALRQLGDVGMASAAGFYQSVVGFVLVLTTNMVVRKVSPDNALF